jgi:hypothetical protein
MIRWSRACSSTGRAFRRRLMRSMRRTSKAGRLPRPNAVRRHDGSPRGRGCPGPTEGPSPDSPPNARGGIILFTGERIASASARHILGEEASRALRQLRVRDPSVTRALEAADDGLLRCLARAAEDPRNTNPRLYCCGKCSVGLWRNLLGGGPDRQEERLRRGAMHLRSVRDGEHQWRKFPFGTRCLL